MYLAPAGRHVYSPRDTANVLKPQRGDMLGRGVIGNRITAEESIGESMPIHTNEKII